MDRSASKKSKLGNQSVRSRKKAKKRAKGLHIIERNGHWHIHGSLKVKGRTVRVRKSTGYEATTENRELAEEELEAVRSTIRNEVLYGIRPSSSVSEAALGYLERPRSRPLGKTTKNVVFEVNDRFKTQLLNEIADSAWRTWVNERHKNNSPQTRERFLDGVVAFLKWCQSRDWIDHIPDFDRDQAARNPRQRKRRRIGEIRPELVAFMVEHASPHLKGQLAAEWSTGGRVSSILHGCRVCDLNLAEGREALTFHNTKNGEPVDAALHPWAAKVLREYMDWRGNWHEREAPLFLTDQKKTYREDVEWGTQNKTAFNGMKKRAVKSLRRQAARARVSGNEQTSKQLWADASLIKQFTQHWFRHMMATEMLTKGVDLRTVMAQGGWLDMRSVMGYSHDVPDIRRQHIVSRAKEDDFIVTSLTRTKSR